MTRTVYVKLADVEASFQAYMLPDTEDNRKANFVLMKARDNVRNWAERIIIEREGEPNS